MDTALDPHYVDRSLRRVRLSLVSSKFHTAKSIRNDAVVFGWEGISTWDLCSWGPRAGSPSLRAGALWLGCHLFHQEDGRTQPLGKFEGNGPRHNAALGAARAGS